MGITGKPQKFIVGLIQMAMARDPATNLEHAIHWIREAAAGQEVGLKVLERVREGDKVFVTH